MMRGGCGFWLLPLQKQRLVVRNVFGVFVLPSLCTVVQ